MDDTARFEEFEESQRETLKLLRTPGKAYLVPLVNVFEARGQFHERGLYLENEFPSIYEGDSGPTMRRVRDLRHALMDALDPALASSDLIANQLATPAVAILHVVAGLLDTEGREALFGGNHVN